MFNPVVVKATALTALKFVLTLGGKFLKNQKADSLIRFTKSTRVEPIVLIDENVAYQPYISDILQTLTSIFTGYYLQAVSLAVNVGRVNVIRLLDTLNPTRDVHDAAATKIVESISRESDSLMSMEAYRYQLPVPGENVGLENFGSAGIAAANKAMSDQVDKFKQDAMKDAGSKSSARLGSDAVKNAREAVNLSVGKLFEVTIKDGEAEATFPIAVRLISTIMGADILAHILGDGSRNVSAKERYHAWRAGQLEFIKDLVLCQDLIDEHRATLMKDKSGVYQEILNRRTMNKAAGYMSDTPSIGTASNLVVLDKSTVKRLEASIGGRISDPRTRDKIFNSTYIMIMVVVDREMEMVTIYHRGIALPTQLSVKELKASNKGTGTDVAEILKAYQLGNNPTI